ncbi:hypothetical protein [Aurantiacibacter gangjinensis]|uniref:Uncharacterized protein n=1 Tax=Aurantiacibacter gangjinensis TaxID=502682 RepID=A0A0G9MK76_9SPHN|nr:hypothetical protein [Aurantiacibacter gangjinensis]APE29310.1 hypothetical protein BMF35_b0055 [Aurantiacibacter gangjinensis]KLE31100.1 hypothetical protein AAW01_12750 [Aurantiacibacter gangjinensis]
MTTGQGTIAPSGAQGGSFGSAYREMRENGDIQFDEIEIPEAEPPPDWLVEFMRWLSDVFSPVGQLIVAIWPVLQWVLIAAFVALVAAYLYQTYGPGFGWKRSKASADREDWVPEQKEALALLEEADRLAAAGQYDEATHLLLKRSVGQIAQARPDLVEPSSTARELAAEPRLPDAARTAFGLIAEPVERSLFALRKLGQEDWQSARSAYADFALAQKAIAA